MSEDDSLPTAGWTRGRPLTLKGIIVIRGSATILSDIDLEFEPGRRYVLVGPSGSGKTTLLRLLNRLEDPSEGSVLIGKDDFRHLPIATIRSGVGLVFQSPRPLPGTVAENLEYPFTVRGLSIPPKEELTRALRDVGLEPDWLRRNASDLSGGERQRLALAVALGIRPEILALDEPTSALDPSSARRIADLLTEKAETDGLRTITVTHHRGHAPMLGDTAVRMDRGKVVEVGPVNEVLSRADEKTWQDTVVLEEAEK